jgi:hypothetical protein
MPTSWWDLGEGAGYPGGKLATSEIVCPFCMERGNFAVQFHAEKKKPNGSKVLNFDTLKCGVCAGYVLALWSADSSDNSHHGRRVLPWPLKIDRFPEHWPSAVGRFWLQAHRNLKEENWDATAVMARSALQSAFRDQASEGPNLKAEINDLATKGALPTIIKDWSHYVRELGNESAHPKADQAPTSPKDARDIVQFLDFLLEYPFDLPQRIEAYRARIAPAGSDADG